MRIFKFGGASVKDADAVRNVAKILKTYEGEELVVVVSAMGKTTNVLEAIMQSFANGDQKDARRQVDALYIFHQTILAELFSSSSHAPNGAIDALFEALKTRIEGSFSGDFHFEYDQLISFGELLSTTIVNAYLKNEGFSSAWADARTLVRTDDHWREGRIQWEVTEVLIQNSIKSFIDEGHSIIVTQGFIGHESNGYTTTLGREGSDFTAAVFAYCLDAEDVTIWKDVPGMLNADPKYFDNTVLLEKISFKEAIELAYFGASVIHPKTIQPLKRKKIPLHIKSFLNPSAPGSVIQESLDFDDQIPSFIFKMNQVLVSLTPKDFSFIIEENLEHIFGYLNKEKIRINLMQNSAVSFSFILDESKADLSQLVAYFSADYLVKYNKNLELVTIRHYDEPTIRRVTAGKKIILEQKSRQTARLVISD